MSERLGFGGGLGGTGDEILDPWAAADLGGGSGGSAGRGFGGGGVSLPPFGSGGGAFHGPSPPPFPASLGPSPPLGTGGGAFQMRSSPPLPPGHFPVIQPRPPSALPQPLPSDKERTRVFYQQVGGMGLGLSGFFAQRILAHPALVLRRQAQVHLTARHFHITPFSLAAPVFSLQSSQGPSCLFKGLSSSLLLYGVSYGLEALLSDLLGLPRSLGQDSPNHRVLNHLLLKGLVSLLSIPLWGGALVESVRSCLASEESGPWEALLGGLGRLRLDFHGTSRRLPLYALVGPRLLHSLSHYVISSTTHFVAVAVIRKHMQRRGQSRGKLMDAAFPELLATLAAELLADAALFPLETLLHRLVLQGTRTLVDDLDDGLSIIPVSARYTGLLDAARSVLASEGVLGFYKGFGALVIQYSLAYALLRLTRFVFERLEESLEEPQSPSIHTPPIRRPLPHYPPPPLQPPPTNHSPPTTNPYYSSATID